MRLRGLACFSLFLGVMQACGGSDGADIEIPPDNEGGSTDAATTGKDVSSSSDGTIPGDASGLDVAVADSTVADSSPGKDGSTSDASTKDASSDVNGGLDARDATTDVDAGCTAPDILVGNGCVTPLILYRGGSDNGALGGRAGVDSLCATARTNLSIQADSSVAFISVDAADEIRDLPSLKGFATNVPIVGPTGKIIANNWADLLDGSIDRTLKDADVLSASELYWYTGSDKAGAATSKTCTGWTDGSTPFDASYGDNLSTGENWIHANVEASCGSSIFSVLCLGY